jgi:DNA-directed RNA polymerase subunit RPC12/RpoP
MSTRCRECGSERIVSNVKVAEPSGPPIGGLLAQLRASVCADCGRVALRAENALDVYLAHGGEAKPSATANIQCPSCGSVLPAAATSCEVCGWHTDVPRA